MNQDNKSTASPHRRAFGISSIVIGCLVGSLLLSVSTAQAAPQPSPVDLKVLAQEIGSTGAYMGQGLAQQTASPTSTRTKRQVIPQATWTAPGVQGLDVSGHQPNVDWAAQYRMGARFAYIKSTEGINFTSPTFSDQYTGSYNVGMIRGAYHFALPSASTAVAQADFFVNNGGGWSADGRTMPPLLDIEYNPYTSLGNSCYNMSSTAMVNWIRDFSNRVQVRTGRLPMIYTTTDWWRTCTGNSGAFGNQPLHIAAYNNVGPGTLPNGWATHSVWQYSASGPFAGDSNAWNGTYDNLKKFATVAGGAIAGPSIKSPGDVVAADANGILWDYPAKGNGTVGARQQIGQGWKGVRSINVIDWNADGVLDLVAQWNSGKVNIYWGVATGGFRNGPVLASSGWATAQLTIGYWLTASNYPQIISRDPSGRLWLWPASGGALGAAKRIGVGWSGLNTTMVDFDGDGNQDLLAQNSSGSLLLYRSNGKGGFLTEVRKVVGSSWSSMTSVSVASDFVGSGTSGLIARTSDGRLYYYPLTGKSGWGTRTLFGTGWSSYVIAGGENIN